MFRAVVQLKTIIIIITSVNKADVTWSFSVILSFVLSFCKQDNWRTRKRTSTKIGRHRQEVTLWQLFTFGGDRNLRVDCGSLFHFLHHWGIGDFQRFVTISLFSEFSYNQQPICTILGVGTDTTDIWIKISPTIRIRIPDHFYFKFWRWRRFAFSTTDRTPVIS